MAKKIIHDIYEPLTKKNVPLIITTLETAETIKYASNAFLAVKISYINEIARVCDKTGADVATIAHAMGLDHRISPLFLKPGPGYGGSCFPKDVEALAYLGKNLGIDLSVVAASLQSNEKQKRYVVEKVERALHNDLQGKTIAILGLAFKANTDDVRKTPAIEIIQLLAKKGAHIKAYDPAAIPNMKKIFPNLEYYHSPYDACTDADAALILTEWDEIKKIDVAQLASLMNQPIVIDTRNIIDQEQLKKYNFMYQTIGRSERVAE